MATTTNYSWSTPDDTALVKDGAAAIRTLGSSVDTTTKALNPSTTLGDIEYRSSTANTNTRLGIGTTGQVLTVSGGVPAWTTASSGSMTLISTTTCSSTSVTLSSIPQTYKSLYIIVKNVTFASGANALLIKPNNVTNLVNWSGLRGAGTATGIDNTQIRLSGGGSEMNNSTNNAWALTINNYAATDSYKPFMFSGFCVDGAGSNRDVFVGGAFRSNTAITSLVFDIEGATFTGGTIEFYGVN
jgi:hypothetical protein